MAEGISSKYLARIWSTLAETQHEIDPLAALQAMWRDLPSPDAKQRDAARSGCEEMRDFVIRERKKLAVPERSVGVHGISMGSQPLVLWKNRQLAASRMRHHSPKTIPADDPANQRREEALARFCEIFPDAFFVPQRNAVINPSERGVRLLSAGFHLMVGYFRDDEPLYKLILDGQGQRELDSLWLELDFVTFAPKRQYKDFVFFERAEPIWFMQQAKFDFARAEDEDVTSEAMIQRLAAAYLAKARKMPDDADEPPVYRGKVVSIKDKMFNSGKHGGRDEALQAIEDYFTDISAAIRSVEKAQLAAQPSHLEALQNFSERAFRRTLAETERVELLAFYRTLRKEGLGHEDAVVSVLMSPHFCYRIDLPQAGEAARPLSDYALASRLSYFLWSSMPDRELLERAATGDLHQPKVLIAQSRRMLQDPRIRGLATEFGGNWLDFRRFEEHNGVDRERFKNFTNQLRQSMYEEPIRFFVDLVRRDGSVLDFLYAKHTFVDQVLAEHYGMPVGDVGPHEWVRVDDARRYGRGGLLPMSAFLTKNSPGLRTSPVKRGYWVVRRLLGQRIAPPPPKVPPAAMLRQGMVEAREISGRHGTLPRCGARSCGYPPAYDSCPNPQHRASAPKPHLGIASHRIGKVPP